MGLILTVFVFRLHKPVSAYAISTLIRGIPNQPDQPEDIKERPLIRGVPNQPENIKENAQNGLLNLRPFTRFFICCLIAV